MKHIVIAALCLMAGTASAAEIKVISGGAVEPGLEAFAQLVRRDLGHELKILYNTAPQIAKRLAAGEVFDILISPPATIEPALKEGKVVPETRVKVGRVGAGIIVRTGAPAPDVATVDALKQALLDADSVVYNTASTGIYLDKLFAKMGIAEALKAKTTRYPTGAAVMEHVLKGTGKEIGFGAMTEIRMYEPKGHQTGRSAAGCCPELHELRCRADDRRQRRPRRRGPCCATWPLPRRRPHSPPAASSRRGVGPMSDNRNRPLLYDR